MRLPVRSDTQPTSAPSSSSKQRESATVRTGRRLLPAGVSDVTDIPPNDFWSASLSDDPCLGCGDGLAPVGPPGAGGQPGFEPPPPPSVRSGVHVREPRLLRAVTPAYPELARQARIGGSVVIECVIDTSGRVVEARVVSGHQLLAPAALDAVGQWAYTPTLLNGVPVGAPDRERRLLPARKRSRSPRDKRATRPDHRDLAHPLPAAARRGRTAGALPTGPGSPCADLRPVYRPRRPRESPLHRLLSRTVQPSACSTST